MQLEHDADDRADPDDGEQRDPPRGREGDEAHRNVRARDQQIDHRMVEALHDRLAPEATGRACGSRPMYRTAAAPSPRTRTPRRGPSGRSPPGSTTRPQGWRRRTPKRAANHATVGRNSCGVPPNTRPPYPSSASIVAELGCVHTSFHRSVTAATRASTASPYCSSFDGPTPFTRARSASVAGSASAIATSVLSSNTT